jgi:hypothetical protein
LKAQSSELVDLEKKKKKKMEEQSLPVGGKRSLRTDRQSARESNFSEQSQPMKRTMKRVEHDKKRWLQDGFAGDDECRKRK